MSSPDPPQIQLALTPTTTSFKRSFEEFGYDLESPVDTSVSSASSSGSGSTDSFAAGSASDSNERHKRARSDSFSSDSVGASASSHRMSGSSGRNVGISAHASSSSQFPAQSTHQPFPVILDSLSSPAHPLSNEVLNSSPESPEVEMVDSFPRADLPPQPTVDWTPSPQASNDQFRISMERFHAFDSHISPLRSGRGTMSDPTRSSPSPPPTLPPLSLPSPGLEGGRSGISPMTPTLPRPPVSHTLPPLFSAPSPMFQSHSHLDVGTATDDGNRRFSLNLGEGSHSVHDHELPSPSTHTPDAVFPGSPSLPYDERLSERVAASAAQLLESRRRLRNLMQPEILNSIRPPVRSRDMRSDVSPIDAEELSRTAFLRGYSSRRQRFARERERERRSSSSSRPSRADDRPNSLDSDERREGTPGGSRYPVSRPWFPPIPGRHSSTRSNADPASARPDGLGRTDREEGWRQFQQEVLEVHRHREDRAQSSRADRSPTARSTSGRDRLGEDGDIFHEFDLPPLSDYVSFHLLEPDAPIASLLEPLEPWPRSMSSNMFGVDETQPLLSTTERRSSPSLDIDSDAFEGGEGLRMYLRRLSSSPRDIARELEVHDRNIYSTSRRSPDLRQDTSSFQPLLPEFDVGSALVDVDGNPRPPPSYPRSTYHPALSEGTRRPVPPALLPEIDVGSSLVDIDGNPRPSYWHPRSTYHPALSEAPRNLNMSDPYESDMPSAGNMRPRYTARPNQTPSLVSENASEWRRSLARSELLGPVPSNASRGRQTDRNGFSQWPTTTSAPRRPRPFNDFWDHPANHERTYPTPSPIELNGPSSHHSAGNPYRSRPYSQEARRPPSPQAHLRPSPAERRPLPRYNRLSVDYHRGRVETEEVPFSSQAAALFASRSTSPPISDSANRSNELHQADDTSAFHLSRSPSPSLLPLSTRDITSSVQLPSARVLPSPPSLSELRRRNNLRSSMNLSSVFPPSPPAPSSERPRPPEVRRRSTAEPSPDTSSSSSSYRNIDLDAYHEGPFRASLERWVEMDRLRSRITHLESLSAEEPPRRSRPPSLPPLQFEDTHEPWPFGDRPAPTRSNPPNLSSSEALLSRLEEEERSGIDFASRRPQSMTLGALDYRTHGRRPPPPESRPSRRRSPPPSSGSGSTSDMVDAARERRQMHTLFSRRSRMEAARIADDGTTPTDGDVQGFSHAIALLRADGMSHERQQQLITRFQRERSEERRRSAMQWGDVEGETESPRLPRLEPRRRFGGLPPLPSMEPGSDSNEPPSARYRRGVAAARFRLPSLRNAARADLPSARERVERIIARTTAREAFRYGIRRSAGDFIRDEDFDTSYEALISLASTLGDVKPRCTPEHVISSLSTGTYQEWANADSDQRCPICLDDYSPVDAVTKLSDCPHWLHKECLEQWLRSATTCPVCRHHVRGPRREPEAPVASSSAMGPSTSRSSGVSVTAMNVDDDAMPVMDIDTDDDDEEMPMSFSDWRFD